MNVIEHTFGNINTHGDGEIPPCIGITPDVLPKVQKSVLAENLQTGVSAQNALSDNTLKTIKRKPKEVPHPNIFFACGTKKEIKSFVYDNINFPHLRFYYHHFHERARVVKEPLIVPDYQIEDLKIIWASEADDVIIVPPEIQKIQSGQTVRVIDGVFKGVIGKVARYHGQQRVAIIIDGLLAIASAYVPSAFLGKNNRGEVTLCYIYT